MYEYVYRVCIYRDGSSDCFVYRLDWMVLNIHTVSNSTNAWKVGIQEDNSLRPSSYNFQQKTQLLQYTHFNTLAHTGTHWHRNYHNHSKEGQKQLPKDQTASSVGDWVWVHLGIGSRVNYEYERLIHGWAGPFNLSQLPRQSFLLYGILLVQ